MKRFLLFTLILTSTFLIATTVRAQSNVDSCAGAFTLDSIQPSTVSNTSAVALVVTGSGFSSGATVVFPNYGGLQTTVVNENVLNAALPPNVPPGIYSVRVINGDGTCQEISGLVVTGPTATAASIGTSAPTSTPAPTNTPLPTNFVRPILNVDSYAASSAIITPGQDFDSEITLVNWGSSTATNVVVSFANGDFTPRATGGVRTVGSLAPGEKWKFYQPFTANKSLWGKNSGTVTMTVNYTDQYGQPYTETYNLGFNLTAYSAASPTPTPTATPALRPKLLITNYQTDHDSIQPGDSFSLTLTIQNVGAAMAKGATLMFNGNAGAAQGAEFSAFAPQQTANLQFVGDLNSSGTNTVVQPLLVNGSAKGGVYSLKFSLVYTDEQGQSYTDDQVISIMVQAPPSLEVGYSEEPDPFRAGQSNALPLQVVNHGLTAVTLGNLKVTAEGATLKNNLALVGSLDAGNYFTLDATLNPDHPGPLTLTITIDYTDAFNQPQQVVKTMTIEVEGNQPEATPDPASSTQTPTESGGFWESLFSAIAAFFGVG